MMLLPSDCYPHIGLDKHVDLTMSPPMYPYLYVFKDKRCKIASPWTHLLSALISLQFSSAQLLTNLVLQLCSHIELYLLFHHCHLNQVIFFLMVVLQYSWTPLNLWTPTQTFLVTLERQTASPFVKGQSKEQNTSGPGWWHWYSDIF